MIFDKYPKPVQEYLHKFLPSLKEIIEEQEIKNVSEEVYLNVLAVEVAPLVLNQFLSTGETTISFPTNKEAEEFVGKLITTTIIYKFKDMGIVNTIEDENGDEIIFLTEEGRETAAKMGIKK